MEFLLVYIFYNKNLYFSSHKKPYNFPLLQALVEDDLFERRRDSEFRDEPSMSREDCSRSSSSLAYQSRSGTHNLFVESDSMSEKYEQGRVQRGPQNGSRMFDEHEQGAQKGWGSETNARGGSSWVSTSSAPRDQHNQLYEDDDDAKYVQSVSYFPTVILIQFFFQFC